MAPGETPSRDTDNATPPDNQNETSGQSKPRLRIIGGDASQVDIGSEDARKAAEQRLYKLFPGGLNPATPQGPSAVDDTAKFMELMRKAVGVILPEGGSGQREKIPPTDAESRQRAEEMAFLRSAKYEELQQKLLEVQKRKSSRIAVMTNTYNRAKEEFRVAFSEIDQAIKVADQRKAALELALQIQGFTPADSENPNGYSFDENGRLVGGVAHKSRDLAEATTYQDAEFDLLNKEREYLMAQDAVEAATQRSVGKLRSVNRLYDDLLRVTTDADAEIARVQQAIDRYRNEHRTQ